MVEVADQLFLGSVLEVKTAAIFRLENARLKTVSRWAKSAHRWHRRAACVALIRGTREKMFFREISKWRICRSLTKTRWSRRDRDGGCAKPRSMMPSELGHI
jgi:hypothetical protein